MNKITLYLGMLTSIIVLSFSIPAYAEVTSIKTNSQFYKGGNNIYFSGTILNTDPPNVTILIFDPTNKFIMLTSAIADSAHTFQIMLDTNTQANHQKFSLKGVYNATAFIANKENGKTVSFVFSPDGSPVAPSPPTSLTASTVSSTEIDLHWASPTNTGGSVISGYKIERNDGNGFNVIQNTPFTSYQDTALTPNKQYSYMVSSMNPAGTSDPTNVATTITLSSTTQTSPIPTPSPSSDQTQTQSLNDILQQRYAAAKKLQEMLNAQTSGPSSTSSSSSSNQQQNSKPTVQLRENIGVGDMAANLESKQSVPVSNLTLNNFANFDIKTMLYPAISLVGIGIVVAILYSRKKRKLGSVVRESQDAHLPVEQTFEKKDDDYALAILKNRLAKGEITVDEFKILKDELLEP